MFLLFPFIQDVHLDNITSAINQGDSKSLANYLDETVEITILEEGEIYFKEDAVGKLKTFFAEHSTSSFQPIHKGFSGGKASLYCIGDFVSKQKSYRVFIYIKVQNDKYFIQELRFEKNKK